VDFIVTALLAGFPVTVETSFFSGGSGGVDLIGIGFFFGGMSP